MTDRNFPPTMVLDHTLVESGHPRRLAEFYAAALQMELEQLGDGRFMCTGPARRILFGPGAAKKLGFAAFACDSRAALDALRAHAADTGCDILPSPSPLFGNEAFAVADPEGNVMVFGLAAAVAPSADRVDALPGRLQHAVVTTRDVDAMLAFYRDALGFRLSDRVEDEEGNLTVVFLRSDAEHHSFAAFLASELRLDHQSLETGEWNDIRDWADRLAEREIEIDWGPGRHGPGNNLFFMFRDPDGNWIEISAELERILPGRPAGVWPHNERSLNYWGRGVLRS